MPSWTSTRWSGRSCWSGASRRHDRQLLQRRLGGANRGRVMCFGIKRRGRNKSASADDPFRLLVSGPTFDAAGIDARIVWKPSTNSLQGPATCTWRNKRGNASVAADSSHPAKKDEARKISPAAKLCNQNAVNPEGANYRHGGTRYRRPGGHGSSGCCRTYTSSTKRCRSTADASTMIGVRL